VVAVAVLDLVVMQEVQEALVVEVLVEKLVLVKMEEQEVLILVVVVVMDQQMCQVVMEVLEKLLW
jgi:hypothetical protein